MLILHLLDLFVLSFKFGLEGVDSNRLLIRLGATHVLFLVEFHPSILCMRLILSDAYILIHYATHANIYLSEDSPRAPSTVMLLISSLSPI